MSKKLGSEIASVNLDLVGVKARAALAAGDSQLILDDVKVPEYYNQLKEFLRSPDNIAKVMSYSPLSIKETILADIPSKLTKQMINCFKLVLEYAGDIQPTTNPPSSPETGTSIIKAIADVLYTSARDEVVLQIVKQYTECPSNQKALIYLDLLIGILTFMKVSIPEVSKFMSEFIANEKAKSQDIFMKKKFSYLESCVAAVNLASTFNPECNSFGWAI
ncbi:MAG: Rho GTPase activating protein 39, partial [Paramarteilia canceri]